jgi:hypothetical protein
VTARIGAERTNEARALGCFLVRVDRIPRAAERRGLLCALTDVYGAVLPERRARVLLALCAEARSAAERARRVSEGAPFDALPRLTRGVIPG